ncbi:MAG: thioesterase family protein, partial [Solirubrobacterales bacterium]|nr:thioesterase family protein [Solirubrobacterales bacterium]
MAEAVFLPDGSRFVATELARGPWDPAAQHGGAPAALLVRAFERLELPAEQILARVTYEFLRPVVLGTLRVSAEVVRAGRRAALAEGSIYSDGGRRSCGRGVCTCTGPSSTQMRRPGRFRVRTP